MYPRLSDLLNDIFGTDILLPVQTYGFFIALAFLLAAFVLYLELRRKGTPDRFHREPLLRPGKAERIKGKPAGLTELMVTAVIGFLAGFKGVHAIGNYAEFAGNPQEFIFSGQGSWWGGVLFAIVATAWAYYDKHRKKLEKPVRVTETIYPKQLTGSILLVAAISGIIGAKLFDVIEHVDQLVKDPVGTLFSFSGLAFYGGLITAAVVVSVFVERNGIPWVIHADAVAPALMLAYGTGRIGCQLSGDGCWGVVNTAAKPEWLGFLPDWMWAFHYPHNVINEGIRIPGCDGAHCFMLEQPVFPTPIYETLLAYIFFIVLWSIRKRIRMHGMLFSIYLVMNGTARLFIEQIRVNIRYEFIGLEVTQATIIAIGLIITGIAGFFYARRWNLKHAEKLKRHEL